jgi:hypothetical protein
MYPWLSRTYKRKIPDEELKDAVHERDKNMKVEFRTGGIEGVDNGEKITYDLRESNERGGFPKGDSRRW